MPELGALADVLPIHVAAWIKELKATHAVPTVKLRLAALRHLFDWLVTGHIIQSNTALSVRGDRHVVRKGVPHLKVSGKGGKVRYLPLHPGTQGLIHDYFGAAGHGTDENGALFRPIKNNRTGERDAACFTYLRFCTIVALAQ